NLKGGQLVYSYIITVYVYHEVTKKLKYVNFYACFCSVSKFSIYLIACSAAILPSPVVVTTCRNFFFLIFPSSNILCIFFFCFFLFCFLIFDVFNFLFCFSTSVSCCCNHLT